ncbi:acyl-CoA synthetase [Parasulfuritortus cantonensis]|uniref:Acyl-CoA synthetase n=1 Tax=Parasulfuritortus cantonensis TaxID=2528202 RepID=A0A4R1BF24_9PROT|nr:AMP-binding protein [Parasulfuritortus cantonensis]TCJ15775.1 acyl-CoA synthetase [Parasulfuritortus cantonensis]
MDTLPLLPDVGGDSIVAYHGPAPVSQRQFLEDVFALAERLPDGDHLLNLCKDRYWFSAGLFAAMVRGKRSVLPNSVAPEVLAGFREPFSGLACLGDDPGGPDRYHYVRAPDCRTGTRPAVPATMPRVPAEEPVLYVHTSGSTGKPQRHPKTLGQMRQGALAGAKRLWAFAQGPCTVLGTVPFQHMFGLESTVFLPLLGGGKLSSRLPFFPADVVSALAELPEPRLLVITPFHLRTLLDTAIDYPPVAAVLSATAPMPAGLAAAAEERLGAPVVEIYGSTETGQIATRRPARQPEWDLYDDIDLTLDGDSATVGGGHLRTRETLHDVIEPCGAARFRLLGRRSDMVNVAGKRSSLAYLNHVIATIPGVRDAVFCVPDGHPDRDIARLAAFVVAPGLARRDLQSALQRKLDPVFLPRPVVFLDVLPRDGNGKLPAAALQELIAAHLP